MPEGMLRVLEKLATWKGIVALILLIVIGIFIFRNLNFLTEITFRIIKPEETKESEIEEEETANLIINDVQMSPFASKLPAFLYFEIRNNGRKTLKEVKLAIDLGRSRFIDYELIPSPKRDLEIARSDSALRLDIGNLAKGENYFFYAHMTEPTFKQIVATSPSLPQSRRFALAEYIKKKEGKGALSYLSFFKVFFVVLISIFAIFLFIVAIRKLNEKWGVDTHGLTPVALE